MLCRRSYPLFDLGQETQAIFSGRLATAQLVTPTVDYTERLVADGAPRRFFPSRGRRPFSVGFT